MLVRPCGAAGALLAAYLQALGRADAREVAEAASGAPCPQELPPPPGSARALLEAAEAHLAPPGRVQVATPPEVARWLAAAALPHPTTALDPAAGTGRLLCAALERLVALGQSAEAALEALSGIELDPAAAAVARCALVATAAERGATRLSIPEVAVGDALLSGLAPAGAILLNPPYAPGDRLSAAHHEALGRLTFHRRQLDQSVFFLGVGIASLAPGGRLAAIAPRYWLEATGAAAFRVWLTEQGRVVGLFDLGDVQVWPRVNVLTALLVFAREPAGETTPFLRAGSRAEVDALLQTPGALPAPLDRGTFEVPTRRLDASPWTFRAPSAEALLERLTRQASPVSAWFDVGQGLKTGCNDVFVLDEATALALDLPDALLPPTAGTRSLQPFRVLPTGERLLLVLDDTDLEAYPRLREHLERHRERLLQRYQVRAGVARWHALSLPQNLALMRRIPKIVTPLYARTHCFAVDRRGLLLRTDAYALAPRTGLPVPIDAVVAVLNSAPLRGFARARAKLKRDGYLEFGRRLLDQLPLPWRADGRPIAGTEADTEALSGLGRQLGEVWSEATMAEVDALAWRLFGMERT